MSSEYIASAITKSTTVVFEQFEILDNVERTCTCTCTFKAKCQRRFVGILEK